MKNKLKVMIHLLIAMAISPHLVNAETKEFRDGVAYYQEESYEEAIESLTSARSQTPNSSSTAFLLGMSYKQAVNYPEAIKQFNEAVTLKPPIKEALVELIDLLYRSTGKETLDEAMEWIQVAEKENIFPAKIAFLKGLILQKQGNNLAGVESFKQSVKYNPKLEQAADVQIGLCYFREKMVAHARERFSSVITQDPQSDLATFARTYQDRLEALREWRFTVGMFGQYNSNLISKPKQMDTATQASFASIDTHSLTLMPTFRVDYNQLRSDNWLFSAQYSGSATLNENNSSSYNSIAQNLSIIPGYNFGTNSLNMLVNLSHVQLRNGEHYGNYSQSVKLGPIFRTLVSHDQLFEAFIGYSKADFLFPVSRDEEDRDADILSSYLSWLWFYKENAFLNLRYDYNKDSSDGEWWANQGQMLSINSVYPLRDDLRLQGSLQVYKQNYQNSHLLLNNTAKRDDTTFNASLGLSWMFRKDIDLILQYTRTEVNSNIDIYEYDRNLYNAGIEYRF